MKSGNRTGSVREDPHSGFAEWQTLPLPLCIIRRLFSWSTAAPGFQDALAHLMEHPLSEDPAHRKINESSGKTVWRCRDGAFDFADKTCPGKKPWRYFFQDSLPVREYRHYILLQKLGFPVPCVLAAGDIRSHGILRESFLVTGYLEGTHDGRIFMPGGEFRTGHDSLRRAYCEGHLKLLAAAHDDGFFHKAFHPRNLLFRKRGSGGAPELFWIDVARLRKMHFFNAHRAMIVDLHTFFRDMRLPEPETLALLRIYTVARKKGHVPGAEQLLRELVSFKRRLFSRKKYCLFDKESSPA